MKTTQCHSTQSADLDSAIAHYRSTFSGRNPALDACRHMFSRMLQAGGVDHIDEERVLSALQKKPAAGKAWKALFARYPSSLDAQAKVLTEMILFDATARVHREIPAARKKAELRLKGLDQAAIDLLEFFASEVSGLIGGPLNDDKQMQLTKSQLLRALSSLTFMRKYLSGRLQSEHGFVDHVLPSKRSRTKLGLSFAGEMCIALNGRFGSPCYEFVRQTAQALYPNEQIGDIESKFGAELAAVKPIAKDIEAKARKIAAETQTAAK